MTALLSGRAERVPVGNVVSVATTELMATAGAWFPDAHLDAGSMTRLAAAGHEVLDYDTVMPVFSVTQEAAALGCRVDWGGPTMMPTVRSHPFAVTDAMRLPAGWMDAPSIRVVLEALALLRRRVGDHVVIVGKAMGPWTLSYHMLGMEAFLVSTLEDPERVRRSLEVLVQVTLEFARAQVQAGADIVCIADHATGQTVSPWAYRDFLLPVHQSLTADLGCPTVLHCCGNTTDRLAYFVEAGFDCYHFESEVGVGEAVRATAGRMTVMGNINNPRTLLAGTPDEVARECRRAIEDGVHILAPECAVPLSTPLRNLRALVEAATGAARA
jgi:[methyl-Co(III) methanol-specific corrinoid protein]:coenzyme M methyltransferase